jgi:hypothetical protein
MPSTENYLAKADSDARDTIDHFEDEILEQLLDSGEASDDLLNDYPNGDSWHHECHTDQWYNLTEAAAILDQLDDFEEDDSGLWEGQGPKDAIATMAAFTYANAVMSEWADRIKEINSEAETILDGFADRANDLENEISELNEVADNAVEPSEADEARCGADAKQDELDLLDKEKSDALCAMIQRIARDE